jgi:hypothetical protein
MLTASIVLFAIAALGGITLATLRLGNRPLPFSLAIAHGVLAATGLVLLIAAIVVAAATSTVLNAALVLFIVAAIGGAILFLLFHLRGRSLPVPLMLGHGLLAVVAFVLLLSHIVAR